MASNATTSLPEPLSSLLGACASGIPVPVVPANIPSLPESDCDNLSLCSGMECDVSGGEDTGFSLVEAKAKRKRKLVANSPPASPAPAGIHGTDGNVPPPTATSVSASKFPPIIIPDNRQYSSILTSLRINYPSLKLEAKCHGTTLKLFTNSTQDFRAVQGFLSARGISFHTFALPEEREIKVVIQGIPHHTPSDSVRQELVSLGFVPTSVSALKTGSQSPVNSFLVKLRKVGPFGDIFQLTTLMFLSVKVRTFDPRPGPSQCFSCQRFGHSSLFCHEPPRCVRCGGAHRGCDKPRDQTFKPHCCNCEGEHPANYRGCPKFIEAERKQRLPARSGAQGSRVATTPPNRRQAFPPLTGTSQPAPATTSVAAAAAVPAAGAVSTPPAAVIAPAPAGAPVRSYAAAAASTPLPAPRSKPKPPRRRRKPAGRQPSTQPRVTPATTTSTTTTPSEQTTVQPPHPKPTSPSAASAQTGRREPRESSQAPADPLSVWATNLVTNIRSARDTTTVLMVVFQSLATLFPLLPLNG